MGTWTRWPPKFLVKTWWARVVAGDQCWPEWQTHGHVVWKSVPGGGNLKDMNYECLNNHPDPSIPKTKMTKMGEEAGRRWAEILWQSQGFPSSLVAVHFCTLPLLANFMAWMKLSVREAVWTCWCPGIRKGTAGEKSSRAAKQKFSAYSLCLFSWEALVSYS